MYVNNIQLLYYSPYLELLGLHMQATGVGLHIYR